jgi:LPS-assembly protein
MQADWRSSFTTWGGLRVEPYVQARVDGYALHDLPAGTSVGSSFSRALGVAGADISWPVYKRYENSTVILEPLAQLAVSPKAKQIVLGHDATGAPVYLDEDSVAFEFDESNLFRANKFTGYDLYEDGTRVSVGGQASVLWDDGRRANFLVGRSFRDGHNNVFAPRTGLQAPDSDWIVSADAQPIPGLSVFARARLDAQSFEMHRAEFGANVANKYGVGFVRYLRDETDINGTKQENLDVGGRVWVTKNWGVSLYGNRDMVQNSWVIRDIGLIYRDDCTHLEIIYRRENTVIGQLGPSTSINIRLTLATLGEPNYGF